MNNNVEHPKHYTFGKYEVIDIIEQFNIDFRLASALKYIGRAGKKDSSKYREDLEKAIWYIQRTISKPNPFEFYYTCFRYLLKNTIPISEIIKDWELTIGLDLVLNSLHKYCFTFSRGKKNFHLHRMIHGIQINIGSKEIKDELY